MEAFISGKKRKSSSVTPPPRSSTTDEAGGDPDDDDSTDFKLALLSSLHPLIEQQTLLDILLACEGSVDKASASLRTPESPEKKSSTVVGYQSSLSDFIASTPDTNSNSPAKKPKLLSKRGRTLHLYSPEDVEAHTPCTIIHNFLPPEEANALLEELLREALTFEKMSFKLFDNVVQSPHTACFYVHSLEEQQRQKTEYIYNGGVVDVRLLYFSCIFILTCIRIFDNSHHK
jgi:hypothetical protein